MSTRSCTTYAQACSAPKRCRLLSFKNGTVLDCFCLDCIQFHSRSLDNVALNSSNWGTLKFSINLSLMTLATLQVLCPGVLLHPQCRSVSYRTSLATVFQSSGFDLLLPQSQDRLHGRIHLQALICTTLDCLLSSKPWLRCSLHSFCHALLASCVPYIVSTRSVSTRLTNAFKLSTGGIAEHTSLGSTFSSSDLAFLISLTTSRALSLSLLFFRTHFGE